jgi:hypothetical protein
MICTLLLNSAAAAEQSIINQSQRSQSTITIPDTILCISWQGNILLSLARLNNLIISFHMHVQMHSHVLQIVEIYTPI